MTPVVGRSLGHCVAFFHSSLCPPSSISKPLPAYPPMSSNCLSSSSVIDLVLVVPLPLHALRYEPGFIASFSLALTTITSSSEWPQRFVKSLFEVCWLSASSNKINVVCEFQVVDRSSTDSNRSINVLQCIRHDLFQKQVEKNSERIQPPPGSNFTAFVALYTELQI